VVPRVGCGDGGDVSTLAVETRLSQMRAHVARAAAVVESWPALRVLAAFVVVEWLAVLALARTVRHAGWIYYQGGDQLWYYTLGWLLAHGQLTQTPVGYGDPVLYAPIARIAGPNLVSALPAIILLNVLVLLPIAMLALYGLAARIGGRLFGYWTLLLWVVVPFAGVRFTNAGYHQRYTELTLPQSLGLTALADFPTMVAALVSMYFVAKAVLDRNPALLDGVAGGVAAGVAIAFKPATALFLVGPALAFAFTRRWRGVAAFAAGAAPAVLALAVWKDRGLGHVPAFGAHAARQLGAGAGPVVAGSSGLGRYFNLDWHHFLTNLDLLREHFWSGRLIEWFVVAGLIGLGRRSRPALLLVGGTFAAFVIVKGTYAHASIEDASLLRLLMPAFPCFVLLLASLPLLLPHAPRALRESTPAPPAWRPRTRWALVGVVVTLSAILPLAAFAASSTSGRLTPAKLNATFMPVPVDVDIGLAARVRGRTVTLSWRNRSSAGGPVFYRVWRGPQDGFTCPPNIGARLCNVTLPELRATKATSLVDRPGHGRFVYRVAVAANWLDDPGYGDPYFVSTPVTVTVP
jgi:hypothetical protein